MKTHGSLRRGLVAKARRGNSASEPGSRGSQRTPRPAQSSSNCLQALAPISTLKSLVCATSIRKNRGNPKCGPTETISSWKLHLQFRTLPSGKLSQIKPNFLQYFAPPCTDFAVIPTMVGCAVPRPAEPEPKKVGRAVPARRSSAVAQKTFAKMTDFRIYVSSAPRGRAMQQTRAITHGRGALVTARPISADTDLP